jgi:hypothetical protein
LVIPSASAKSIPLRVRRGQIRGERGDGARAADDALGHLAAQPDRLDPVLLPARQPSGQPQLLDQLRGEHGLLGDVDGVLAAAEGPLGDDGAEQPDLGEFQRVRARVGVDGQRLGGDTESGHNNGSSAGTG